MLTIIEGIFSNQRLVIDMLRPEDISLSIDTDALLTKALVLAAASEMESRVTNTIRAYVREIAGADHPMEAFLVNQALERKYHTLFDWNKRNANSFFGKFGESVKEHALAAISNDDELRQAVVAFLELGNERNTIVHENFAAFSYPKTPEEVIDRYRQASLFCERLPTLLRMQS